MRLFVTLLLATLGALQAAVITCPAGIPVGAIQLRVQRSDNGPALPLRTINRIEEGDRILYSPVLRTREKRHGKVTLVLAPANSAKRSEEGFVILDPKPADKPAQWKAPFRASLAVYVYGPNGLSTAKVRGLLERDTELIGQLADYAEKTAQTEALLQALDTPTETPSENFAAALQGFAANYGINNKLDRTAPTEQQTLALFRSLNPALSAYDPISPQGPQRLTQTAGLATTVAAMFFGSTVGLAAGGTAMALNLKTLLFPNEEFRSSYTQVIAGDGVALCGRREPPQGRTRLAYLWAERIPDQGAPQITIEGANNIPLAQRSTVRMRMPDPQWKIIDRARDWRLQGDNVDVPVTVKPLADQHTFEIDLSQAKIPAGNYRLVAKWDWERFAVGGDVAVKPLSSLEHAHLTAESQDKLLQRSGKKIVHLEGDDFQFVERAALIRTGDKYSSPVNVPFSLPIGPKRGPQQQMELQIDTTQLDAGDYQLVLAQQSNKTQSVNMKVLAEKPEIENLPLAINAGETDQSITLRGRHLDRITALKAGAAVLHLTPARSGGEERAVRVKLPQPLEQGATLDLSVGVKDYAVPLIFPAGLKVAAPRPRILESKLSLPADLEIGLRPGELPAGIFVSAILKARRVAPTSGIELGCKNRTVPDASVPLGSERNGIKAQTFGSDSVFLSFDPGAWPIGCILTATVDNGEDGRSEPFQVGHVIRLPRVDSFKLTEDPAGEGAYVGVITGRDLEVIDRAGWDAERVLPVLGLPTPIVGEGQKQSLKVKLPWPSPAPHSPLFVCFRGESECRATTEKW